MEEKELARGKFHKMNIPALVCLVIAVISTVEWDSLSRDYRSATDEVTMALISAIGFAFLAVLFFFWMSGCSIVVTNKRVYGTGAFRKRVDLPFDMISSVGSSMFSVAVATASGKIVFWFIKNKAEVSQAIINRLLQRQEQAQPAPMEKQTAGNDLEKLKELKQLLDMGIITQEEFDAKKKQLLGL